MKYLEKTEDFDKLISAEKVLVDFYADWCGPCRMIAPILEELSKINTEITIVKVDVDKHQELAQKYGVMSIPTLIYFEKSKQIKQSVGFIEKSDIEELIKN